ncbi:hypothetical protein RHMOL_Rhmol01G0073900 [Rhododendron molle]|uniref:Uncharacterized protein n=1 Tax=Rhododendron molle TaxID=49168 RepID=A0ACC0Q0E0_RHOML|nr:hypothetical protein RHMOL_Rhmol01G0073900 [Rhododendron molle]
MRLALWQLLWVNLVASPNLSKSTADVFSLKSIRLALAIVRQETADHLLYPNPGSLMVDEHLQYFHFLGTILAKVGDGAAFWQFTKMELKTFW